LPDLFPVVLGKFGTFGVDFGVGLFGVFAIILSNMKV
jgi:hypothetical protein